MVGLDKPIPLTRLVATREGRVEPIAYWMRIGYDVTNSNWARNALKLEYGLRGSISDGALFRVSTLGVPEEGNAEVQDKFIHDLLNALPPDTRSFMVGDPSKLCCKNYRSRTPGGAPSRCTPPPGPGRQVGRL